jgi:outer membrane protein
MNSISKLFTVATVCLALVAVAGRSHAESPKIAVVITQKLLTQTEAGKKAAEKLQAKKKSAQEKLDAKAKEITEMQESFQKKVMLLSDDEREKAGGDLERAQRDGARLKEDLERELQKAENEVLGGVNQLLTRVVVDYGKQNGYDMILDASASLYFSEAADITDDLVKAANAAYKKGD